MHSQQTPEAPPPPSFPERSRPWPLQGSCSIKAGKITDTKDEHGEWHVEPAELHRVYPPVADAAVSTDAMPRYVAGDAAAFAMVQRAAQAEERLSELKAILEDMRSDRYAWRDQAQAIALTVALAALDRVTMRGKKKAARCG